MKFNDSIEILQGKCERLLQNMPSESVDAIITDPPYLYLKNHKLDKAFDEKTFFNEAKRVLKKNGFIVMFGRGSAFYRWNTMLDNSGFIFKEEIIWNKVQTTSPLSPLSRIHETISIHCKGKGKINKVRIPYLEMKGNDIGAIKQDIKRLMSVFSNAKSFQAVNDYLSNFKVAYHEEAVAKNFVSHTGIINHCNRNVAVIDNLNHGLKEKSIIRLYGYPYKTKHDIPGTKKIFDIDRPVKVARSMEYGCVEKSIIQQTREHYAMQHPTQKPVRLIERLIPLVTQEGALVLDTFMGSGTTGIACFNTNRRFIGMELDEEYFGIAHGRIETAIKEKEQDLFYEKAL